MFLIALPHGVVRVFGAGSIAAWPAQASDRARSVRLQRTPRPAFRVACLTVWSAFGFFALEVLLPGGVTGSTGGFGPPSSGSSPDRVVFLKIKVSGFLF